MKILVAVASRHGSTMEIANEIGKAVKSALGQDDTAAVDVLFADTVTSMDGYDGVILGSAVYMGHWLDSMRKFADTHGDALRVLPVWLFSTGPVDGTPDPADAAGVDGERLAVTLCAREHRMFGGKIDKSGLHFGERAAVTLLRLKDGDYRDWPSIRDWAKEISASLHETHSGV
jgi:menaquinone-dependent protoporphyrinogen oxidase